jgi:hypothetical protein
MTESNEFTVREFFRLAMEAATHEAELKIKLAKAGVTDRAQPADERDEGNAD